MNSRACIVHYNIYIYIYIYNLPLRIKSISEQVLFADNTSVIISSRNFEDFCSVTNSVLSRLIKLFAANNLVINLDKTSIMKFITKNSSHSALYMVIKTKLWQIQNFFFYKLIAT